MNKQSTPNREKRFSSRAERDQRYSHVFRAVTSQYVEVCNLPVLCAMQIAPEAPRPRRLTTDDIHFRCDVERSTEQALQGRPDLQAAWFRLAEGDLNTDPKEAAAVIHQCGRIYDARGLAPWLYYKTNKYPRKAVSR